MPKNKERRYRTEQLLTLREFARYGRSWAHDARLGRKEGNHFRLSCRGAASDVEAGQSALYCVLCAHVGMRMPGRPPSLVTVLMQLALMTRNIRTCLTRRAPAMTILAKKTCGHMWAASVAFVVSGRSREHVGRRLKFMQMGDVGAR